MENDLPKSIVHFCKHGDLTVKFCDYIQRKAVGGRDDRGDEVAEGLVPRSQVALGKNKLGIRIIFDEFFDKVGRDFDNCLLVDKVQLAHCFLEYSCRGLRLSAYVIVGQPLVEIGLVVGFAFTQVFVA